MLTNYDQIVARLSSLGSKAYQSGSSWVAARTTPLTVTAGTGIAFGRAMRFEPLPSSFESGVTAYIPLDFTAITNLSSPVMFILGEMIDFGSLDLSTNVFTPGVAMPSRTVFNTSKQLASPIIVEGEVANNATPGTLVVTYKDQDGSAAEAGGSYTITASGNVSAGVIIKGNSPDWGAVQVTNAVRSGGTTPTGTLRFWGMIPICLCVNSNTALGAQTDLLNYGIVARLGVNTKIGVFTHNSNAANAYIGRINYVGDN